MATKIQGSYHGFQVKGDLLDDRSVKFTDASDKDGKPAKFKLAGKSFPNARQAGRAAFDAITDYEKLPRLPDVRFMKLLTVEGKGIGSTAPRQVTKTTKTAKVKTAKTPAAKTAKSKTKTDEPSEVVSATGVRKSNPKVNQAKNNAAKTARKASPVKTAKVSPKSATSTKSTKRATSKVSAEPDELDF